MNASLIYNDGDTGFLDAALAALPGRGRSLVVSDDPGFLAVLPVQVRLDFAAAGLDEVPVRFDLVRARRSKMSIPSPARAGSSRSSRRSRRSSTGR